MKSSIQRKLALLIGTALALAAFAAPSATAATQVKDAVTGQLCPETVPAAPKTEQEQKDFVSIGKTPTYVSGGCTLTLQSNGQGQESPYLLPGSSSNWLLCTQFTYTIHIGPTGWGYADNFQINCGNSSWNQIVGTSQPIVPVEYTASGPLWPDANAATDFNARFRLFSQAWPGESLSYLSLDVTQALPLRMANQATGTKLGQHIKKGIWAPFSGVNAGLTVTH